MIGEYQKLTKLYHEIDSNSAKKIDCYVIGGAAMLYRKLKPATKDIDIVVNTPEEFLELQKTLHLVKFSATIPGKEYAHMNLNQIFIRDDYRIDLFCSTVCEKFRLSASMIKRATKEYSKKLCVHIISNEDIFLFKTMTDRAGDLDDCVALARQGLNWKIIFEELLLQTAERGVWITWVAERLDILEQRGVDIPVKKKIDRLCDKYYRELEKRKK